MFLEITDGLMVDTDAVAGVMKTPSGVRIYVAGQRIDVKVSVASAYEKLRDAFLRVQGCFEE